MSGFSIPCRNDGKENRSKGNHLQNRFEMRPSDTSTGKGIDETQNQLTWKYFVWKRFNRNRS